MVTGKHQERDLPLCCMRGRADTLRLQPPLPRHQDLPAGALPTIAGSRSSSKTPKYRRTFLSSCAKRGVNPAALTGLRTEVDDMWCASQITAHLLQGCSSRARARRAQEVSAANESALALNTQVQRSRCPRGAAGASSMAWSRRQKYLCAACHSAEGMESGCMLDELGWAPADFACSSSSRGVNTHWPSLKAKRDDFL